MSRKTTRRAGSSAAGSHCAVRGSLPLPGADAAHASASAQAASASDASSASAPLASPGATRPAETAEQVAARTAEQAALQEAEAAVAAAADAARSAAEDSSADPSGSAVDLQRLLDAKDNHIELLKQQLDRQTRQQDATAEVHRLNQELAALKLELSSAKRLGTDQTAEIDSLKMALKDKDGSAANQFEALNEKLSAKDVEIEAGEKRIGRLIERVLLMDRVVYLHKLAESRRAGKQNETLGAIHEHLSGMRDHLDKTLQIDETLMVDLTCARCYSLFQSASILPCGHTYCEDCIVQAKLNDEFVFCSECDMSVDADVFANTCVDSIVSRFNMRQHAIQNLQAILGNLNSAADNFERAPAINIGAPAGTGDEETDDVVARAAAEGLEALPPASEIVDPLALADTLEERIAVLGLGRPGD